MQKTLTPHKKILELTNKFCRVAGYKIYSIKIGIVFKIQYSQNNLIKTKDWAYEDEYRLILNSGIDGEIDKEYRILKYDFQNMRGLIFGINTTYEDKVKIFEIIQNNPKEEVFTGY